jgi:hypothetical protein
MNPILHVDLYFLELMVPYLLSECLEKNSLAITRKITMKDIVADLEECERLKKTHFIRSDHKHIFGDYGRPMMYTSAGVQVSRNSPEVLNCNAFLQNLPAWHWTVLMKLIRNAEDCFERLADSEVISHMLSESHRTHGIDRID